MDVCTHRWIDRTIFTAPYPTPPPATPRGARTFLLRSSYPLAIEITRGRARGIRVPRDETAEGPRCSLSLSLAMGSLAVSRLYLYL